MVSISYHGTVKILQGAMDVARSPFARLEWLELLRGADDNALFAVATHENDMAALPLTKCGGRFEPLMNWYNFTWEPVLPSDPALLTALAADLKTQSHRITLWPIADESGQASLLKSAFVSAGWKVLLRQCDHNHVLEVNGRTFAEYWASRPGKMRTTLKRKAKKVEVEILTAFDREAWAEYERIYQNSWKPEEGDAALLRAFAQQEGDAGRIRLALARYEGRAVAAQFWTVENGTAYIHKLAHLDEMKGLSAGTTLTAALFERVIDRDKVELVDFGTGNDLYKADWMEEVRPRYRLDCLDPRQPKAWPALAKRFLRKLAPKASES